MLVLSRHRNEKIIITCGGINIDIIIVDIRGDKVRVGIQAPNEVSIHREEVYDKIKQKEKES